MANVLLLLLFLIHLLEAYIPFQKILEQNGIKFQSIQSKFISESPLPLVSSDVNSSFDKDRIETLDDGMLIWAENEINLYSQNLKSVDYNKGEKHQRIQTKKESTKEKIEKLEKLKELYLSQKGHLQDKLKGPGRRRGRGRQRHVVQDEKAKIQQWETIQLGLLKQTNPLMSPPEKLTFPLQESLQDVPTPQTTKIIYCSVSGCTSLPLFSSSYCQHHIISQPHQVLFQPCSIPNCSNFSFLFDPGETNQVCSIHLDKTILNQ